MRIITESRTVIASKRGAQNMLENNIEANRVARAFADLYREYLADRD